MEALRHTAKVAEEGTDRATAVSRDAASKAAREKRAVEEQYAEAQAQLARERADRKADAAGFSEERKEAQVRLLRVRAVQLHIICFARAAWSFWIPDNKLFAPCRATEPERPHRNRAPRKQAACVRAGRHW